jgi:hypothetical protein
MSPRRLLSSAAIAGAIVVAGCMMGGQSVPHVTWNLRQSHTKSDVGWKDSLDATSVSQTVDVTILLPAERSLSMRAVREDFQASGNDLQSVAVLYAPTSNDDGYQQAKDVARSWGLGTAGLDEWHQQVVQARQHGSPESQVPSYPQMVGTPLGGPSGPTPVATVLNSYDDAKPFQLRLEFQWV